MRIQETLINIFFNFIHSLFGSELDTRINRARTLVYLLMAGVFSLYFYWFSQRYGLPLSKDSSSWGTFGDFIGGVLNPVVAFFAFYWLTESVRIQQQEMKHTRETLEETTRAQDEQAAIASEQAIFSKDQITIDLLNMKYQLTNTELEAEISYRDYILNNGMEVSGHTRNVFNLNGETVDSTDALKACQIRIDELKSKQEKQINALWKVYGNKHDINLLKQ